MNRKHPASLVKPFTPMGLDLSRVVMRTAIAAGPTGPAAALPLLASEPMPVLLDSAATDGAWGRYSVLACRPMRTACIHQGVLELDGCRANASAGPADAKGRRLVVWPDGRARTLTETLRTLLASCKRRSATAIPYGPGWIGYLGYELAGCFERLPAPVGDELPDAWLGFYDAVAVHDGVTGEWVLCWLADPEEQAMSASAERLRNILEASRRADITARANAPCSGDPFIDPRIRADMSAEAYRRSVRRAVEYIAAGDIFQVNLSQRFCLKTVASPLDIYQRLGLSNPAQYAAFLAGPGWAVLSSSPELFLRVREGRVITRPIKGTRRRSDRDEQDRSAAAALLASQKDNAELAMIIDLLRNDLGRVCSVGTVRVTEPRVLESHPTVHHLVGTVEGRLAEGLDLADLMAAAFPGGSITGAPKIRAMEIINELEPCRRGPYTGSICHFGVDGSAELSIIIRTAVWRDRGEAGGEVSVHAGGGIVADSTDGGEYQETLDKARAVLSACLGADDETRVRRSACATATRVHSGSQSGKKGTLT